MSRAYTRHSTHHSVSPAGSMPERRSVATMSGLGRFSTFAKWGFPCSNGSTIAGILMESQFSATDRWKCYATEFGYTFGSTHGIGQGPRLNTHSMALRVLSCFSTTGESSALSCVGLPERDVTSIEPRDRLPALLGAHRSSAAGSLTVQDVADYPREKASGCNAGHGALFLLAAAVGVSPTAQTTMERRRQRPAWLRGLARTIERAGGPSRKCLFLTQQKG